jgi:hypothetical protein
MNFDDMMRKILELFPEAIVEEVLTGEITIATGMTENADGYIVPLEV